MDELLSMPGECDSSDKRPIWQLWRQDDNGVRVLVTEYAEQGLALKALEQLESHHHKQMYWVIKKKPDGQTAEPD